MIPIPPIPLVGIPAMNYALVCAGKGRLDIGPVGSQVPRPSSRAVSAEDVALAAGGKWGPLVDAALWVQAQVGHEGAVLLVREDEALFTEPAHWPRLTLEEWKASRVGHGVWFPTSWGIPGAMNPKGLTRLQIVR